MKSRQTGLTLIELMIAVFILGIIASAAVPSMQSLLGRKNIHAVGKIFDQSIRLARAEAIQRTAVIHVKPQVNGATWAEGWQIEYTDTATSSTEIIKKFSALKGNPVFTSDTFSYSKPLTILPNGQAADIGNFNLYYTDCASSAEKISYQLMLSGLLKKTTSGC